MEQVTGAIGRLQRVPKPIPTIVSRIPRTFLRLVSDAMQMKKCVLDHLPPASSPIRNNSGLADNRQRFDPRESLTFDVDFDPAQGHPGPSACRRSDLSAEWPAFD